MDSESQRLHEEAQAAMAAGRWEAAAATLDELARRQAAHPRRVPSPAVPLPAVGPWPGRAHAVAARRPVAAPTARQSPRVLLLYAAIALVIIVLMVVSLAMGGFAPRGGSPRTPGESRPSPEPAAGVAPAPAEPTAAVVETPGEAQAENDLSASAAGAPAAGEAPAADTPTDNETPPTPPEPCVDRDGRPLPPDSWLCRGYFIVGAPPPRATATTQPYVAPSPSVPPYAYQVLGSVRAASGGRIRYETNIVVPPSHRRDELIAVLAGAARQELSAHPDAQVVAAFAYSSPAQVSKGYDRGRALVSRDSRGWTGDRTFDAVVPGLVDEGKIYITLGTVLDLQEHVAVDR